jgi:N-acetylglucosamine-6-phosphate deacetylase
MGSLNAARLMGIDDEVGSLEVGKRANILLMDDMVQIKQIYFDGDLVVENGQYCG